MADSHPAATAHDRQTSRVAPPFPLIPRQESCSTSQALVNDRFPASPLAAQYFIRPLPIDWTSIPDDETVGAELYALIRELYPIPRSLTGEGVRETLAVLARDLPLDVVRRRPAPRCSTGSCHGSGTSATRGSRRRTGVTSHGSGTRRSTCSVTASRSTRSCRGTSFWSIFSPTRSTRTGSVPDVVLGRALGLLYDAARGRLAPRRGVPRRDRRDLGGRIADVRRGPGRRLGRRAPCCSRPRSAIPRLRTTTSRASSYWRRSPTH